MDGTNHKSGQSYEINILGQTPILAAYGQIMVAFPLPHDHSTEEITGRLNDAAVKLYALFPRLAGQVVNEGQSEDSTGTFLIRPYPPHEGPNPVLVKDYSRISPPWHEIRDAGGPMSMLPEEGLSSKKCIPHSYAYSLEVQPVLVIQANLVNGGIFITFSLQHQAGDGTGFGYIMKHIAALMRGEDISDALIAGANFEDADMHQLLRPNEKPVHVSVFEHKSVRPNGQDHEKEITKPATPAATWACFRFTSESLRRLKTEASVDEKTDAKTWISTNDALLAFLWKRLTIVRLKTLSPETVTQCSRAVDMRDRVEKPLPEGYMGYAALICHTSVRMGEIQEMTLSRIAIMLRQELKQMNGLYLRSLATIMTDTANKYNVALVSVSVKREATLVMSSWAELGTQSLVFGPLGKPAFSRRAEKMPFLSSSYVLPKFENGDMDLQLCLLDEELEALRNDKEWNIYTEYIG